MDKAGSHTSVHAHPDEKMSRAQAITSTQKYRSFVAPCTSVRKANKKSANAKRRRRDKEVEL